MCNLSQGVWQDSKDQTNLISIANVMHSLNCDQIKAMQILGLSEKDQERYTKMFKETQS